MSLHLFLFISYVKSENDMNCRQNVLYYLFYFMLYCGERTISCIHICYVIFFFFLTFFGGRGKGGKTSNILVLGVTYQLCFFLL